MSFKLLPMRTTSAIFCALVLIAAAGARESAAQVSIPPVGMTEADFEASIASGLSFDAVSLLPAGTMIIDDFCYQDGIFGCIGRVDATVGAAPAPSLSGFIVEAGTTTPNLMVEITLHDLAVRSDVIAVTGVGFFCRVDLTSASTSIAATFNLSEVPGAGEIDVTQLGDVVVVFGGSSETTNCEAFLGFITEAFVGLMVGNVRDLLKPALGGYLNTVDVNGNTPMAAALESALEPPAQLVPSMGPMGLCVTALSVLLAAFVHIPSARRS